MYYVKGYVKVSVGQLELKTIFEGLTSDIHEVNGGWDIQGIHVPTSDITTITKVSCETKETLDMSCYVRGDHLRSKQAKPILKKKVDHPEAVVSLFKSCKYTAKKWQAVFDEALKEARRYKRIVPHTIITGLDDTIKDLMEDVRFFHYANNVEGLHNVRNRIESAYINAVWEIDNCKTAKQFQKEMFGK